MTYLEIVNAVRERCGASGGALTTTVGQTGVSLQYCNWVNDAWFDIQSEYEDWFFMRARFSFDTVNLQQIYTPAQANTTNFANYKKNSLRIYVKSIGTNSELWLPVREYEYFRNLYLFGAMRNVSQKPVECTIDPLNKNMLLGGIPNSQICTINGEYYTAPQVMSASTDVPSMPAEYHKAIMYKSMMHYAGFDAASEVYQMGEKGYNKYFSQLELNQLPQVNLGEPML
jgi:hypothetical protein